ncbi:hypothetical protein FACS189427_12870 [Planctomycetales bacterium]|nr:hypothetical protein FACS189427_12870 [Planctomycetales bacterium]
MLRFISSCTLLCSLFFVTVEEEVLSQTDDRAKAIDMFRKSVEQRERIKSGHWIITHRSDEIVPPPLQNSPVTLDIAFEGKKHRIHKKIGEREIILCLDCMPNTFAAVVVHPLMYNPPVPTNSIYTSILSLHRLAKMVKVYCMPLK